MYFIGIGTLGNMLLITAGSLIGLFLGKRFPEKIREILMQSAGLAILFIGISGALSASFFVNNNALGVNFTMTIILSLFIGGAVGQFLDIEGALERLGQKLQHRLVKKNQDSSSTVSEGFCMASILFCTGAMAIVGSLNDALLADPSMLYTKGFIDGITSIIFASTLGYGVIFSALSVGIYQGVLTTLAALIAPLLTETIIAQMSAVGSLIIVAIALTILGIRKFRIANLLPAIFIPLVWYGVTLCFI